jgi:scyllo-inositol 2-dehydrogenase (NADP+)
MKLGIVGSGTIVQEFLPKLCKLEGLEIKGIQGVTSQLDNIKKLCNENNIELATNSFDTLLQSGIDTLYVALIHFMWQYLTHYTLNIVKKG